MAIFVSYDDARLVGDAAQRQAAYERDQDSFQMQLRAAAAAEAQRRTDIEQQRSEQELAFRMRNADDARQERMGHYSDELQYRRERDAEARMAQEHTLRYRQEHDQTLDEDRDASRALRERIAHERLAAGVGRGRSGYGSGGGGNVGFGAAGRAERDARNDFGEAEKSVKEAASKLDELGYDPRQYQTWKPTDPKDAKQKQADYWYAEMRNRMAVKEAKQRDLDASRLPPSSTAQPPQAAAGAPVSPADPIIGAVMGANEKVYGPDQFRPIPQQPNMYRHLPSGRVYQAQRDGTLKEMKEWRPAYQNEDGSHNEGKRREDVYSMYSNTARGFEARDAKLSEQNASAGPSQDELRSVGIGDEAEANAKQIKDSMRKRYAAARATGNKAEMQKIEADFAEVERQAGESMRNRDAALRKVDDGQPWNVDKRNREMYANEQSVGRLKGRMGEFERGDYAFDGKRYPGTQNGMDSAAAYYIQGTQQGPWADSMKDPALREVDAARQTLADAERSMQMIQQRGQEIEHEITLAKAHRNLGYGPDQRPDGEAPAAALIRLQREKNQLPLQAQDVQQKALKAQAMLDRAAPEATANRQAERNRQNDITKTLISKYPGAGVAAGQQPRPAAPATQPAPTSQPSPALPPAAQPGPGQVTARVKMEDGSVHVAIVDKATKQIIQVLN